MKFVTFSNLNSKLMENIDKYTDYCVVRDSYYDVDIYVKENATTFLVSDIVNESVYTIPKPLVNELENSLYDEEEILNLLTIIYRKYDEYGSFMKANKIKSKEEVNKNFKNFQVIIKILTELMKKFDYNRVSKLFNDKKPEEVVDLFYIYGPDMNELTTSISNLFDGKSEEELEKLFANKSKEEISAIIDPNHKICSNEIEETINNLVAEINEEYNNYSTDYHETDDDYGYQKRLIR